MNNKNNGLRRNNSSCGSSYQQKFEPFMLGSSRGYSSYRMPQMASVNTVSAPATQYQPQPPTRTSSLYNNANTNSVRDCMYWPASLNYKRNAFQAAAPQANMTYNNQTANAGDFQYCAAPPKVYISAPGVKARQQNIPCQIAPLGTDPATMIKPLQPLTVRVQAPSDLFTGNPSEPRTISISPAQLYGGR